MKTYRKIDIYYDGKYMCSTMQSKTCKEAKERFIKKWEDDYNTGFLVMQCDDFSKIKAYFSK